MKEKQRKKGKNTKIITKTLFEKKSNNRQRKGWQSKSSPSMEIETQPSIIDRKHIFTNTHISISRCLYNKNGVILRFLSFLRFRPLSKPIAFNLKWALNQRLPLHMFMCGHVECVCVCWKDVQRLYAHAGTSVCACVYMSAVYSQLSVCFE